METVVKTFVGLFFSLVLLILGIGMIAASVNARNATAFAAECASRIENSDFADSVVQECEQEAAEKGYVLEVEISGREDRPEVKFGSLSLEYPFRIPLIGVEQQNVVEAGIR